MRVKKVAVEITQSLYHISKRNKKSTCMNALWTPFICNSSFHSSIIYDNVYKSCENSDIEKVMYLSLSPSLSLSLPPEQLEDM